MARDDPQVNFRIPEALKKRLEKAAADSGRTLTAEIVQRLNTSFEVPRDSRYQLRSITEALERQRIEIEGVKLRLSHEAVRPSPKKK